MFAFPHCILNFLKKKHIYVSKIKEIEKLEKKFEKLVEKIL